MIAATRHFLLPIALALVLSLKAEGQAPAPQPAYRIRGMVINALTGEPVSGAAVGIVPVKNLAAAQSVVTGQDGSFDFQKLRAGKYSLQAQGHGFSQQAFNEHEQFSTAIVVGPNLDSENIQFRLWPDATLSGTVSDEQNEPVQNAQLMLLKAEDRMSSVRETARAASDDQGHYRFSHIRPGRYYLAVSAQPWYADRQWFQEPISEGESGPEQGSAGDQPSAPEPTARQSASSRELNVVYPITYYPGSTDPAGATAVVVKPGDRVIADMALFPVPALYLRVREPSADLSQPLAVTLLEYLVGGARQPVPAAVRMGKGVVELGGIPPGHFLLTARMPGPKPAMREKLIDIFTDTETELSDASSVPVITGLIVAGNGQPISRPAYVHLFNHSSGQELMARSSAKGEFEIKGEHLDPGKYDVQIMGIADRWVESVSASGGKASGSEVEISAGSVVQMRITVSSRAERVDGTALSDGKPFAGAMIVLVPEDLENHLGRVRRDQSDSDGSFSLLNVLPGRYTVVALANGWDLDWQSPGVLQPYLDRGTPLKVPSEPVLPIKVTVE